MKMTTRQAYLALLALQVLLGLVLLKDFVSGKFYFAWIDIGSDTYAQLVPHAMQMARNLARWDFSGWSFETGIGAVTAWAPGSGLDALGHLAGQDKVLALRVWVYLLKIALGGAAFFALLQLWVRRPQTALIGAIAYSFCGYAVTQGQWDPGATEFVFYPLILWAVLHHLRRGGLIALPLVLAAALVSNVFFVSVTAFLAMACVAFVAASDTPRAMLRQWLTRILPLAAAGYLLAAPHLLPVVLQLLDSPRVSGDDAMMARLLRGAFLPHDGPTLLAALGALFHKDIFGIGNFHKGPVNYFEAPEFFIGVLLLIAIPQLWAGSKGDRKVLLSALAALALYVVFPLLRYAAFGFAAPYFRVSSLWVSLLLLMLAVRAIDRVLDDGVDGPMLLAGAGACGLLLAVVASAAPGGAVSASHVVRVAGLALLATALLALVWRKVLPLPWLPPALVAAIALETLLVAAPSYVHDRVPVAPEIERYNDLTHEALRAIRDKDSGVFRIEKTYDSAFLADALAQGYMGIKSYAFQNAGTVRFNAAMGLIDTPPDVPVNWIPNAGNRFFVNTLLGVKYVISRGPMAWPGFVPFARGPGWEVYRNEMALPMGFVQPRQMTQAEWSRLATGADGGKPLRDAAILNTVVVAQPLPALGAPVTLEALFGSKPLSLQEMYVTPGTRLQRTGLKIQSFASNRITGTIQPDASGMLVFSIPFNSGWSLTIDGQPVPLMPVNFGLLGAPVAAGPHAVALDFQLPGRQTGLLLSALGLAVLALMRVRLRGAPSA